MKSRAFHPHIHLTKFPELLPVPLYLVARQRAPSRSNHFSRHRMVFLNNIWLIFTCTFRSGIYKNGNLPKFSGWKVKIKHIWNHHLVNHVVQWFRLVVYFSLQKRNSTVKIVSISETPSLNQMILKKKYSSYFSPSNLSPKLPSCSKTSCHHPNHHSISFLHLNVSGIPGGIPLPNNHFQDIQAVPFSSPSWRSV